MIYPGFLLVELLHYCAQSVATPAPLCHKEPAQGTQSPQWLCMTYLWRDPDNKSSSLCSQSTSLEIGAEHEVMSIEQCKDICGENGSSFINTFRPPVVVGVQVKHHNSSCSNMSRAAELEQSLSIFLNILSLNNTIYCFCKSVLKPIIDCFSPVHCCS